MLGKTLSRRTAAAAAGLALATSLWVTGAVGAAQAAPTPGTAGGSGGQTAPAAQAPAPAAGAPAASAPAASAPAATETTPVAATPATADAAAAKFSGRVIARIGLKARQEPRLGSPVVALLQYQQVIGIDCKVNGDDVGGNKLWYRLAGYKSAYAAARYVTNIGAVPGWC